MIVLVVGEREEELGDQVTVVGTLKVGETRVMKTNGRVHRE